MIENVTALPDVFFSVDLHHAALQFSPGALTSKQKSFLYVRRYSFKMSVMGCWRKYGFHMFKDLCFFLQRYIFSVLGSIITQLAHTGGSCSAEN